MKKKLLKGFLLIGTVVFLSSCNRGYGCPNNFSIGDTIEIVKAAVLNLF